jgi:hypothetical protein
LPFEPLKELSGLELSGVQCSAAAMHQSDESGVERLSEQVCCATCVGCAPMLLVLKRYELLYYQ